MTSSRTMPRTLKAFLFALGISALMFLPFVIMDRGYFIYYGDFNVQQIPFYKLAHEAIRSGDVLWSWYTDLGANFIGSYSFYLLFSPFFWLTLPFPTAVLPYLMAPLLVLKTACAAAAACLFLQRFVRDRDWAIIGGLLYAFSGWMDFNIFFNHFHEVAVFFPLLLHSLECLVCENRKGYFAFMVAVCAMVNYWFFVGEVVFVVLYIIVRTVCDRSWGMNIRKFVRIALESTLGVLLATGVLLPSVLALMGNPRTGVTELLTGWNFWLYWHQQYYMAIPHSLFFPPDLPARPNFFPDRGAKWSSLSGWLPLLGMTGVLAYFFQRKKDWLKKLLAICLLFAMVPGFNSLFILLNHSYYARWFFMPVLLMALVTIRSLEDSAKDIAPFSRALKWCLGITIAFIVICGLTPQFVDGGLVIGLAAYKDVMWMWSILALICLLLVTLLIMLLRHHARFKPLVGGMIALVSVVFGIYYISQGKNDPERSRYVVNNIIGGREYIDLPMEPFARSDIYDGSDNQLMFWHLPNIQAFHSIVPVSIMEFYPEVGVKRDVGSRPEVDFYALRPLLSVRWLFINGDKSDQNPMPGYTYWGEQNGHIIYENQNYLPMGFAYEQFIAREQLEYVEKDLRSNFMLRVMVLEDGDPIYRNEDLMEWYDLDELGELDEDAMWADVQDRLDMTCYDFRFDKNTFTARSSLERETLMFFSVPYEAGWSATVNGEEALIEKVNVGFMAVRVPAGESVIHFTYMTPGLKEGAVVSAGALIIFLGYVIVSVRRRGHIEEQKKLDVQRALFEGETVHMTWEEFLREYRDKETRSRQLQQKLNEASALHIKDRLDEEERSLSFSLADAEAEAGDDPEDIGSESDAADGASTIDEDHTADSEMTPSPEPTPEVPDDTDDGDAPTAPDSPPQ